MEKALDIDNSDPTLFFKFAVIAIRAGDLMSARNALEVSLRVTETIPGQQIRHWPTLDLLITVTYKLEDCLSCLRHIDWALKVIFPRFCHSFSIFKYLCKMVYIYNLLLYHQKEAESL